MEKGEEVDDRDNVEEKQKGMERSNEEKREKGEDG